MACVHDVMVLIPHPDDELWLAGTIALTARDGARVRVVCMTRGEAGTDYLVRPGGRLVGDALAAWREDELHASAALLGVTDVEVWGLPDGRLEAQDEAPIVTRIADAIATCDTVLTLGADGVYGHRDHTTTTRWLRIALGLLATSGAPVPEALGVVFAPGLFDTTWASFAKRRPELAVADWVARGRGTPVGSEAREVDIRSVEDIKRRAIRAHASQLRGPDETAFFVPGTFPHLMGHERFERLAPI